MTPLVRKASRRETARRRLEEARRAIAHCELCAHRCGADRTAGELGPCRAGPEARIFSSQVEVSDELELSPVFAIAFGGCDLRCSFCITGAESWNPRSGRPLDVVRLSQDAEVAVAGGVRSLMILGGEPTLHLPAVLELVAALPEEPRLIWKTNAHGTAVARELLEGVFDLWVVDFKFGNDACAERLSGVPHYTATVRENLVWAATHTDLIVRHLLMPGHIECCWRPVAEWLAAVIPGTRVNLRSGFWPAWQARRHSELQGIVRPAEAARAADIAEEFGLHLIQ